MKKLLLVLSFFLASTEVFAVNSQHCPGSCPSGTPSSNFVVFRDPYTLSNNATTKFADWVAYRITPSTIQGGRSRNFRADPILFPSRTLEPNDYDGAAVQIGTDRGHQAPLASLGAFSNFEVLNYLSNVTPQAAGLNQGPWNILEDRVRRLVQTGGFSEVFVLTGPLYEFFFASLPNADESHRIPSGYWKVLYTNVNGNIQTAAFIMEQTTPRSANFCFQQVTIDEVEFRSRLNLFPNLSGASTFEARTGLLRDNLGC
ncbi:DNA/RNA non-specific endonuclease [Sessilibacter sp. MAH4]